MTQPTHITDYLAETARRFPDKSAFVCSNRTLTWVEVDAESERMARVVIGVVPKGEQQVVGLLMYNSWQFIVAYLGILRAGHIVLPLDPSFKKLENESITEQVKPAVTITNNMFLSEIPDGFETILFEQEIPESAGDLGDALRLPAEEQIATLLFTSGTTGKPKVTAYTHANHMWNIDAVAELWKWTADDTILLSLPLSHWHGLVMGVAGAIHRGNTVYLPERFSAEDTVKALLSGDVSLFMHVPIAYFKLVEYAGDRTFDISKVRLCISGSSYLPPAIWEGFKKAFGQEILERYGSSETGLIASNTLDARHPGVVGHVLPGVEVRVESDGQLSMRSPGRFLGYFRNPEATEKNFTADGMWLTGDIGEFNGDGELQLKGRIQEKIKKLGYTVFPRDVEWALMQNPAVHDVVVVGVQVPDALSDTMVYFTVSDLSEQEITDYCKKNLPGAWRPDRIIKLDEMPKTRSGKPKLAQLRTMI
jgi:acyl-CoA synthetase (AMP-forming)/AMP-acid ligase II